MIKKIAFCFLIYDIINHEEEWYNFFKDIDEEKYSIYVHYKEQKELLYFEKYKLKNCIPTKYATISLVYAHRKLFEEALKDGNNYKFINLSGSCIPVKSFDYIYNKLTNDDNSYMGYDNGNLERCISTMISISRDKIYKSSEWIILNRIHASICTYDNIVIKFFEKVFCVDEHYFATILRNIYPLNITFENTTFANWQEPNLTRYPKNYNFISDEEYKRLLDSNFLFARKFNPECKIPKIN